MAHEHTFIMVKPDGVARGLVGEVIGRLENKGLRLEKIRQLTIDEEMAGVHYGEHVEKPFFGDLVAFITSGPVVAMEWSGDSAVSVARTLMGATDPKQAAPGTIRGDFGLIVTNNIVHGSDSVESGARELGIFFGDGPTG
ncbi:MAG: nucleoside-diphosphate kinase [Acidimicrobiia bacterium]|nr:nucleoside-diphosphate kinase [Acidimicrobiia bacterium]